MEHWWSKHTKAEIAAAFDEAQAELSALKWAMVKPLEWRLYKEDGCDCVISDGMGVTYEAGIDVSGQAYWSHHRVVENTGAIVPGGISEAKAAAQEHYTARILSALTIAPGWKDMETAPKDRVILLFRPKMFCGKGHVGPGKWESDKYANNPRPFWYSLERLISTTESSIFQPTHWMPLPLPPEEQEG